MKRERAVPRPTGRNGLQNLARLVGLGLLVASVVRELRLPKEERTWHGVVFGWVPYDLRPPTYGRLKAALWNPQDSHVVVPTALGVGWTVNLAALRTRLSRVLAA
ncbi:MAG TPA: DUF5808 domain-containing protein [Chloroflexota bacterium]|jgi:hypothetical protein